MGPQVKLPSATMQDQNGSVHNCPCVYWTKKRGHSTNGT
jgi:hypothetical protein